MTLKEKLNLINPLYWPAWLGLGILWMVIRFPYSLQLKIGCGIGRMVWLFGGKLKKTTKKNIELCFPNLSKKEQNKLIQENFLNLGIGVIEAAQAWWLPSQKLNAKIQYQGLEHIQHAFQRQRGVILVSPHFTSLELVGRLISTQYDFAILYRPHKNQILAFIQETFRKKNYHTAIPRHRIHQVKTALKNNMAIWYAYDVDAGRKRSVFAPFFGIQTASLTSISRLVALTQAAVIPIGFYREDRSFRYTIQFFPELKNFSSNHFLEDAIQLNQALETSIRIKPEQYLWQYKRFKTRPLHETKFYD